MVGPLPDPRKPKTVTDLLISTQAMVHRLLHRTPPPLPQVTLFKEKKKKKKKKKTNLETQLTQTPITACPPTLNTQIQGTSPFPQYQTTHTQ